MNIKGLIKKFIPKFLLQAYHYSLAVLAKITYRNPSEKLIVVGITGTAGKSSAAYFTAQILEKAGLKVGMTTTTLFKIGEKEWLNSKKMTMLGRFQTQKLLKRMARAKCDVAIIETSSQGIEQFRHVGINYDIAVLTNLYPEHIEAHGGFANYKQAKGKLFAHLPTLKHKNIKALKQIKKTIIVNGDDENVKYFLQFKSDQKIVFTTNKNLRVTDYGLRLPAGEAGITNVINDAGLKINLLGDYNVYNVLAAIAVAKALDIKTDNDLTYLKPLPGRLEFIKNNLGIKILVDYVFEPKAMEKLYNIVDRIEHKKIIHVLGAAGGGRDKAKRPILGKMANKKADVVVITNEDPYDEDPQKIIDQVAEPVTKNKLYKILDRREAIRKALKLAEKDDLILVTGKGAEQAICVANEKKIPWDDRQVIKEELEKLN